MEDPPLTSGKGYGQVPKKGSKRGPNLHARMLRGESASNAFFKRTSAGDDGFCLSCSARRHRMYSSCSLTFAVNALPCAKEEGTGAVGNTYDPKGTAAVGNTFSEREDMAKSLLLAGTGEFEPKR